MKRTILLVFALGCITGAAAAQPQENPFSFEGAYVGDFYANAAGGIRRGAGYMGMGNLRMGFDTGKAGLWRGGSFFVNGASIHGKSLSERFLGDLQVASNIDAGEHVYMHELWFGQRLGRVSLTVGLQDLNVDFMTVDPAGEFLNSSFGVPPVISGNMPVPIFPLTGLGLSARWEISDRWTVQGALYDGCQRPFESNPHNLHWDLGRNDGMLAMGEVHYNRGGATYKLGAYYHSGLRERDGDTGEMATVFRRNYGFYALASQCVGERLSLFGQLAVAPGAGNETNYYIGLGACYALCERIAPGLAVAHAGLHEGGHRHETTIEAFVKYTLDGNIAIQPDVQYIIDPAGTDAKLDNALVGILRVHVNF